MRLRRADAPCLPRGVGFARHRTAFGRSIATFPLVREKLALIKAEEQAALASTLALTALVDRLDRGGTDDDTIGVHRFLVTANKYVTSLTPTLVVRRAIETFGGNGTIEDFSPLPRLYRDAIVFESWEGAHNVLVEEEVRRDAARFGLVPLVLADLLGRLGTEAKGAESASTPDQMMLCSGRRRPAENRSTASDATSTKGVRSSTRSRTISPTAGPWRNPWPEKPVA